MSFIEFNSCFVGIYAVIHTTVFHIPTNFPISKEFLLAQYLHFYIIPAKKLEIRTLQNSSFYN